jgi:hypothetical protein
MRREDKFGESRPLTRTVALARLELTDPAAEQQLSDALTGLETRSRTDICHRSISRTHCNVD